MHSTQVRALHTSVSQMQWFAMGTDTSTGGLAAKFNRFDCHQDGIGNSSFSAACYTQANSRLNVGASEPTRQRILRAAEACTKPFKVSVCIRDFSVVPARFRYSSWFGERTVTEPNGICYNLGTACHRVPVAAPRKFDGRHACGRRQPSTAYTSRQFEEYDHVNILGVCTEYSLL
jgi:hypothetical protein